MRACAQLRCGRLAVCSGGYRRVFRCQKGAFKITGRIKHFLSVVGEHLSVDNMNTAIRQTDLCLNAGVKEFAVTAVKNGSHWAHQWYVSADNPNLNTTRFRRRTGCCADGDQRRLPGGAAICLARYPGRAVAP
ncbi:MAG: GH3 auxin-responsive promoter family protein [Saprospirales bacterium]|nr:GH3 auxin-responsive promoter family protein [Saprospirales bacterium]